VTRLSKFALLALILAAAAALVPLPAAYVETWYATGLYPAIQSMLTFASNALPFALLDVLIGAVVAALILPTALDAGRGHRFSALWRLGRRGLVGAAWGYLMFLTLWGLNYRRVPLEHRLPFDPRHVRPEAVLRLLSIATERLNSLHSTAHSQGFGPDRAIDPVLAGAFDGVARALSGDRRIVAGRPKHSILDWYFERAGVSGMTDPFFLETLIASDLLPFERPFVIAHEWAHLAGLADEGEANLAGWLTCLRAAPAHQYSAWLFMYSETSGAVPPRERREAAVRLIAGPRDDLRAIRDRVARHVSPAVASAGWSMYDSYLKANRIEAGALSYDQVVRLALGLQAARAAIDAASPRER
jgi:hypothetical protein